MQLKEVMTPSVEVIAPEATIQAAAEKMSDLDIGLLPVCEGGRLVGVVTDRDITVRAVTEGRGEASGAAPQQCLHVAQHARAPALHVGAHDSSGTP